MTPDRLQPVVRSHTLVVVQRREQLEPGERASHHRDGDVNFLGDEGETRVREAYPGTTWDRLVAVKSRYDPTNLFRVNQNISPA
jgi:FAD/FMN-containing dehydrogenase